MLIFLKTFKQKTQQFLKINFLNLFSQIIADFSKIKINKFNIF